MSVDELIDETTNKAPQYKEDGFQSEKAVLSDIDIPNSRRFAFEEFDQGPYSKYFDKEKEDFNLDVIDETSSDT